MRILLTGRNGQVGWELERALPAPGEVIATDRGTLDLADADAIRRVVRETKPDVIVNAAAYNAVDKAESEVELALQINAVAPGVLADEAKKLDALLVHYSTDYVFDGLKRTPYVEDDAPNPLSVYGRSKLEGERATLASRCRGVVLRTSWVYAPRGRNFFLAIAKKAKAGESLRVVSDQTGVPNTAAFIAEMTLKLLGNSRIQKQVETYHLSATGPATWHDFAVEIVKRLRLDVPVAAIRTQDYAAIARRPACAVLESGKLAREFDVSLPAWQTLLDDPIANLLESAS